MHYDSVATAIETIRRELDAACERVDRNPADVTLIAVSKRHPAQAIAAAIQAGVSAVGESYMQEAFEKQQQLPDAAVDWHFIGHIQSRKAKDLAGRFSLIHAVDSIKVATKLHNAALERGLVQPILLQVNVGREAQKHGVAPEDAVSLAQQLAAMEDVEHGGVRLDGFMCLPPRLDTAGDVQPYFALLRGCKERAEEVLGRTLPHLSMGMSHDFTMAVAEGATLVRIGTAIFGERPPA